jgi:hypothetical protein
LRCSLFLISIGIVSLGSILQSIISFEWHRFKAFTDLGLIRL